MDQIVAIKVDHTHAVVDTLITAYQTQADGLIKVLVVLWIMILMQCNTGSLADTTTPVTTVITVPIKVVTTVLMDIRLMEHPITVDILTKEIVLTSIKNLHRVQEANPIFV